MTHEPGASSPVHVAVDAGLRAKEPARIEGMFDAIAARYDLLNRVLSAGLDQRWRARAVRSLRLQPTDTVLDLCTGTADVALTAAPAAARVVGVDFSHEMLRLGLEKVRAHAGLLSSSSVKVAGMFDAVEVWKPERFETVQVEGDDEEPARVWGDH